MRYSENSTSRQNRTRAFPVSTSMCRCLFEKFPTFQVCEKEEIDPSSTSLVLLLRPAYSILLRPQPRKHQERKRCQLCVKTVIKKHYPALKIWYSNCGDMADHSDPPILTCPTATVKVKLPLQFSLLY